MKKIALDLDGVIFDSENLYRVCAEIHDVDNFKSNNIIDNSLHKFEHRYSWTKEESDSFYKRIVKKVLSTAHLMTGIELVIEELMKKYEMIIGDFLYRELLHTEKMLIPYSHYAVSSKLGNEWAWSGEWGHCQLHSSPW